MALPSMPSFKTSTVLALGVLAGCLLFTPMIALVGAWVLPDYREVVQTIAETFRDALFIVLGFYFGKADRSEPAS